MAFKHHTVYITLEDGTTECVFLKNSKKPFFRCYDRTYYDKKGIKHSFFTNDINSGKKSEWTFSLIITLITLTILTIYTIFSLTKLFLFLDFSGNEKIEGDISHIIIEDNAKVLNNKQEIELIDLFYEIYDKTGMPITLYTATYDWKNHYNSIENYSKELYYQIDIDENSMLILFTVDKGPGYAEIETPIIYTPQWDFYIYRGKNTTKCLSYDECYDFKYEFKNAMNRYDKDLAFSIKQAWNSIKDGIETPNIDVQNIFYILFTIIVYILFCWIILYVANFRRNYYMYKYFKENPDKLSTKLMTVYNECPNCKASNESQAETCLFCGFLLKLKD